MDATTIAIDLAKDTFEVAISARPGQVTGRRRLTRRQFSAFIETLAPATTVVMEACSTAHYWGRRCQARGAEVRLLPAQYVRPYVHRNKTDRTDAEALLEAHRCARLYPVPIKTVEQQTIQAQHRLRQAWQRRRTACINELRALLREQGIFLPVGPARLRPHVAALLDEDGALPPPTREMVGWLLDELAQLTARIATVTARLEQVARTHPIAVRLQQIPGMGPLTATALVGSVPHMAAFHSGRHLASWFGLTPREISSGGRQVLGRISKRGDPYLRTLLIHGARAVLYAARRAQQAGRPLPRLQAWAVRTADRRGPNRAAVALANKLARVVWAIGTRDQDFIARPAAA